MISEAQLTKGDKSSDLRSPHSPIPCCQFHSAFGDSQHSPCGGASAIKTTIFAAFRLHSSSVNAAAIPDVTASGPSPPPDAIHEHKAARNPRQLTDKSFQVLLHLVNVRCERIRLGNIGIVLWRMIAVVDDLISASISSKLSESLQPPEDHLVRLILLRL